CYDRRLAGRSGNVAAVLDGADLAAGDDAAEYRRLPVIVGSNQRSGPIVQFQSWIIQGIGDSIMHELRANGANDHPLWPSTFNNETANHHVLAGLDQGAGREVGDVGSHRRFDLKREVLVCSGSPFPHVGAGSYA